MGRDRDAKIVVKLLKDVPQRWRWAHSGLNREGEPVRMARRWVRVLTDNNHTDVFKIAVLKRCKCLLSHWKDVRMAALCVDKAA